MITKLIWPKCREMKNHENAFWVGCTDEEVTSHILPNLNGNKDGALDAIKQNRGASKMEDDQTEGVYCNFFLISADGTNIISYSWSMPYAGMWNASNPFLIFGKHSITTLRELKVLEELLQRERKDIFED